MVFKQVFEILDKTGHLNDTIIIGSGDHGEDPFKDSYVRVASLNSNVLHTLSYIYYPKHLMSDPLVAERLRRNTQKITHITDIYPTIQGIINGAGKYDILQHTPDGCITGVDLTSVDLTYDRVTMTINLASRQSVLRTRNNVPWQAKLWALSTTDTKGHELSLYYRKHKYPHPRLEQGEDNYYILKYGECTRNISQSNLCMEDLNDEYKEIFKSSIQWLKETPHYHAGVKNSELVEKFLFENNTVTGYNDASTPEGNRQQNNLLVLLKTLMGSAVLGCILRWKIRKVYR